MVWRVLEITVLPALLRPDDLDMLGLDTDLDVRAGVETLAREEDLTDVEALLRVRLTLDDPRLAELPRLTELPRLDLPPPPRPLFAKTGSAISIRTKTTAI